MVRPSGVRLAAGAEFGWLGGHVDLGDRSGLLAALEKFGSPGDIDPGVPWVAVIVRADRTALLAASTMSTSGLFWTIDIVRGSPTLLWSEDLGVVVRSRHSPTSLDAGWLSAYVRGESTLTATPYADVHRVPPGRAAAVDAQGAPSVTAWLKASWGEPDLDLEPAIRGFRSVFDCAVRRLTLGRTTHAIALSGGLDSTYAAACVAGSLKPGAQAIGYVSSPLPALSHNPRSMPLRTTCPRHASFTSTTLTAWISGSRQLATYVPSTWQSRLRAELGGLSQPLTTGSGWPTWQDAPPIEERSTADGDARQLGLQPCVGARRRGGQVSAARIAWSVRFQGCRHGVGWARRAALLPLRLASGCCARPPRPRNPGPHSTRAVPSRARNGARHIWARTRLGGLRRSSSRGGSIHGTGCCWPSQPG